MVHIWGLTVDQICNLKYFTWIWSLFVHGVEIRNKKGNKFFLAQAYEGWFPPILTFKFCYAILLCCYSVFESYYSLSNSVIHFSDFIMPLWILLFSFQFCYSLSNYVMQFSNPVIRLYSPLMQFWILLFPFKFCCCRHTWTRTDDSTEGKWKTLFFSFDYVLKEMVNVAAVQPWSYGCTWEVC